MGGQPPSTSIGMAPPDEHSRVVPSATLRVLSLPPAVPDRRSSSRGHAAFETERVFFPQPRSVGTPPTFGKERGMDPPDEHNRMIPSATVHRSPLPEHTRAGTEPPSQDQPVNIGAKPDLSTETRVAILTFVTRNSPEAKWHV